MAKRKRPLTKNQRRKKRQNFIQRAIAYVQNFDRRRMKIRALHGLTNDPQPGSIKHIPSAYVTPERQRIINSMTNRQRNLAGRECKGQWDKISDERLEVFANLEKDEYPYATS